LRSCKLATALSSTCATPLDSCFSCRPFQSLVCSRHGPKLGTASNSTQCLSCISNRQPQAIPNVPIQQVCFRSVTSLLSMLHCMPAMRCMHSAALPPMQHAWCQTAARGSVHMVRLAASLMDTEYQQMSATNLPQWQTGSQVFKGPGGPQLHNVATYRAAPV
jgi:hypothetical protein